jgi:hypothetical protein
MQPATHTAPVTAVFLRCRLFWKVHTPESSALNVAMQAPEARKAATRKFGHCPAYQFTPRQAPFLTVAKWRICTQVARIVRIMDRYRETLRVVMNAFGGMVLAVKIFLFSHLIACLWYYLGTIDQDEDLQERTPLLQGWVVREWGGTASATSGGLQTCQQIADGEPDPVSAGNGTLCLEGDKTSRYITALYWAMMTISTVGYGDVTAKTDLEKAGSCLAMLFGALIFAAITVSGCTESLCVQLPRHGHSIASDTDADIGTGLRRGRWPRASWRRRSAQLTIAPPN